MITWTTSRRTIAFERPLVMAILNVTPDSFSDGGKFSTIEAALRRAEECISEGANILDIGGESTRPGSSRVPVDHEIARVGPVIEAISKRFDIPISVDTSKSEVAAAAVAAGAEIINDISSLRFDRRIADVAADSKAGLMLMYSRGDFEEMHEQPPVRNILAHVIDSWKIALTRATAAGVDTTRIAFDVGIGFGKTAEQNLELIGKVGRLALEFPEYPIAVGTSRKSFIAKVLGDMPVDERLIGSITTASIAAFNGAHIVRVHDVKETLQAMRLVDAVLNQL